MIKTGNILAIQEGAASAVANVTLAGIIMEALNHESVEQIYGAFGGIDGLLNEALLDLAQQPQKSIRKLESTPGMAMGSSRRTLESAEDIARAMEVIKAHNIRYILCIGDEKALQLTQTLSDAASAQNYAMNVIALPQSNTNHFPFADHSPGYGSAAKALATQVAALRLDLAATAQNDSVSIITLNDDKQGWLTAAAALSHPEGARGPIVCLPQIALEPAVFVEQVRTALVQSKCAQVVVGQQLMDLDSNYLAQANRKNLPTPAQFLQETLLQAFPQLHINVHDLTTLSRLAALSFSKTDCEEATLCGEHAVIGALEGVSNKAVVLIRSEDATYSCDATFTEPQALLEKPKAIPSSWIHEGAAGVNQHFVRYLQPLIRDEVQALYSQGLPEFGQLQPIFAKRLISGMVQHV